MELIHGQLRHDLLAECQPQAPVVIGEEVPVSPTLLHSGITARSSSTRSSSLALSRTAQLRVDQRFRKNVASAAMESFVPIGLSSIGPSAGHSLIK